MRLIIDDETKELRRLFHYDRGTGIVTRKVSTASRSIAGDVVGCKKKAGYLHVGVLGKTRRLHRVVWKWVTGDWPSDMIDHKDGVRDNNVWSNLRDVTTQDNNRNAFRKSNNTSGVTGVHRCKARWRAQIRLNRKTVHLGYFDDKDEARAVRKAAEAKHGFHPNHGRGRDSV